MRKYTLTLFVLVAMFSSMLVLSEGANAKEAERPPLTVEDVLRAFRPLVAKSPWVVQGLERRELPAKKEASWLPEDQRRDYLKGAKDSGILVADVPDKRQQLIVAVLRFDTVEDASAWAGHQLVGAQLTHDQGSPRDDRVATLVQGAGTKGRERGFFSTRESEGLGYLYRFLSETFAVGKFGCVMTLMNLPGLERSSLDQAVDYVSATIRDPEAAKRMERPGVLPIWESTSGALITIVDSKGNAVPRATLHMQRDSEDGAGFSSWAREFPDEGRRVVVRGQSIIVRAYAPLDAEGRPLNLVGSNSVTVIRSTKSVELKMRTGLTISGRLVDAEGEPVAVARIRAAADTIRRSLSSDVWLPHAVTDKNGLFTIVGLGDAKYTLLVSNDDEEDAYQMQLGEFVAGSKGLTVSLPPEHPPVTITVLDPKGRPLGRASVLISALRGVSESGRRTELDGTLIVRGLDPAKTYSLWVSPRFVHGGAKRDLQHLKIKEWKPRDTRVQLKQGWVLRGVVLDGAGKPIEAMLLRSVAGGQSTVYAYCEEDGTFAMGGLPLAPVRVAAVPKNTNGFSGERRGLAWVVCKPGEAPVTLRLDAKQESSQFTVRVLGPSGGPVPSVSIWVCGQRAFSGGGGSTAHGGIMSFNRPDAPFFVVAHQAQDSSGVALPFAPAMVRDLGDDDHEVIVRMSPGRTLRGVVRDAHGEPVQGVAISAHFAESSIPHASTHQQVVSHADGTFEFVSLGAFEYKLKVTPPLPYAIPRPIKVAAAATSIDVQLSVAPVSTLRVVDYLGAPVPGTRIRLMSTQVISDSVQAHDYPVDELVDQKGELSIQSISGAGALHLSVRPPAAREDLVRVYELKWDGKSQTITFERGYTIRGVVKNEDGPVAGARIVTNLRQDRSTMDPMANPVRSGEDGHFTTRVIPYGPVQLRAEVRLDGEVKRTPYVEVTPASKNVELVVERCDAVIHLRVKGAKKGTRGFLLREDGEGGRNFAFAHDERTSISDLAPGRYTVFVPGLASQQCAYKKGVETSTEETQLDPIDSVDVRIRVDAPKQIRSVRAVVRGPAGEMVEAEKGVSGVFVARGLPPGNWVVFAQGQLKGHLIFAKAVGVSGKVTLLELKGE